MIALASCTLAIGLSYLLHRRMSKAAEVSHHFQLDTTRSQPGSLVEQLTIELEGRKRAESALKITELKLRILTESQMFGVVVASFNGSLLEANDAFLQMLGFSRDELAAGKLSWHGLTPPEYHALDHQQIQQAREQGKCSPYEKEFLHKDGHLVPVLLGFTRLAESDLCLAYVIDLSERHLAAQKLRLSEQRLSIALEAAQMGTWEVELPSEALIMSERMRQLLELSAEAPPRTLSDLFAGFHAEDGNEDPMSQFRHAIEGSRQYRGEIRLMRSDGKTHWLSLSGDAIKNRDGVPVLALGIISDVTASRQIQEYLRESQRQLKRDRDTLKARTEELARSNADLEQFAYIASHDLKEPLRMISSYVQLLHMRYSNRLDPEAVEYIAFAVEGAKRMQSLIQDLLAYSRVGRETSAPLPTDFNNIVEEVQKQLALAIRESAAIIECERLPRLTVRRAQFAQVFQNLIGNALKFRSRTPPRIAIGAREQAADWLFWVKDNGIGIDPQYRDKVFALFKRLHSRAEYAGTGIGLAICKKIVERRGGRIWVESTEGEGATFYFTIPLTCAEES